MPRTRRAALLFHPARKRTVVELAALGDATDARERADAEARRKDIVARHSSQASRTYTVLAAFACALTSLRQRGYWIESAADGTGTGTGTGAGTEGPYKLGRDRCHHGPVASASLAAADLEELASASLVNNRCHYK